MNNKNGFSPQAVVPANESEDLSLISLEALVPEDLKILVVDDEPTIRRTIRDMIIKLLKMPEENILEAPDTSIAKKLVKEDVDRKIGIVFSDVKMPGVGGFEFMAHLKADRPDVRRVVVSGEDLNWGDVASGSHRALQKPFTIEEFRDILRENLQMLHTHLPDEHAVEMRKMALRIDDYLKSINDLVRMDERPDLKKYSSPKKQFDAEGLKRFFGNEQIIELVPYLDWEVGRTPEECAKILGVTDLFALQDIFRRAVSSRKVKNLKLVTCHFGLGNGKCMDEFQKKDNSDDVMQTGVTLAILYRLSNLLDRSIRTQHPSSSEGVPPEGVTTLHHQPSLNPEDSDDLIQATEQPIQLIEEDFKKFNQDLNDLLLSRIKIGRDGRYKIDLRRHEDLIRLIKEDLLELAADPEVMAIANGTQRSIKTSTGLYAGDKRKKLCPGTIECFRRLVANPTTFFETYYPDFFKLDATGDIDKLLDIRDLNVLFGNFRDLNQEKLLGNVGQIFTFTPIIKSSSHLGDYDYTVAVNEIITRLVPGGGFIDDGVLESYTWHYRIDELRQIQAHLGPEYRFYLIGNGERPYSVIIQRGRHNPNNVDNPYVFDTNELNNLMPPNFRLVRLENFERAWSDVAYMNHITRELKSKYYDHLKNGIIHTTLRVEGTQTWKNAGFEPIYKKVKEAFEEFRMNPRWKPIKEKIKRKKGASLRSTETTHIGHANRFGPFWTFFAEKYGDIDRLIQQSLEKHYKKEEEVV